MIKPCPDFGNGPAVIVLIEQATHGGLQAVGSLVRYRRPAALNSRIYMESA